MLEGTVKWFSLEKGYGFIKRKGGANLCDQYYCIWICRWL